MPLAVGALREAVRSKSIGLSITGNLSSLIQRARPGSNPNEETSSSNTASCLSNEQGPIEDELEEQERMRYRLRQNSVLDGAESPPDKKDVHDHVYVEPPSPPTLPPGGLYEAATKNVQSKMKDMMEIYNEVSVSHEDDNVECSVFLSKTSLFSDRLVLFLGDSDGSSAGIWSSKLCVRSGREGGGIVKGALGSMLPYIAKAKNDKLGIIMYDDVFKGCVHYDKSISDMRTAVLRFIAGWRTHVLNSRATHVFIIAYRDGSKIVLEALRDHFKEMQRHISGIVFLNGTHSISSKDPYVIRKLFAQWAINYIGDEAPRFSRLKAREAESGCICLSAGSDSIEGTMLQQVVDSVFASFKARWSGFRVKNANSGMERNCYLCKSIFTMRRWRRHCRTCQNPCCEKCSSVESTRLEGQVRLCLTCRALPSLVQWSRPRAVRTGEKDSVFSGSAKPGKMSVADFELVTIIGRGACGKVLLVQKKDGADAGRLYAMKVLKKNWVMDKDLVTQTMAERRILQEANHPYIVQLKYAFQNHDKLYMVMDYYSGGSLRQVLRRRGRFSIRRAQFYLAQILLAISHLHVSNILYRDLKLENIVITADGNVACTDFGLSKEEMDDENKTSSFVGTCEYLAPELILKEGYGKAVDWWAFGILSYEMIQGDSPFRHQVPTVLFEKILNEEPVFSERFPPEAVDLISGLLEKDPQKRLGCGPEGVEEIKCHPFFNGIDWEGLLEKRTEVPRPPHRMEDVTDEHHLARAIAKMRDAREEIMPDSPVSLPSSPSEQMHFDRFSYLGADDWHPSMANMNFDDMDEEKFPEAIGEEGEEEVEAMTEDAKGNLSPT